MSGLVDSTQLILGQAVDGLSRRQAAISSNLANIDTPGYRPESVDFETALQQELDASEPSFSNAVGPASGPSASVAMRVTDPRQIATPAGVQWAGSATTSQFDGTLRNDGNKVDVESELTALTETQIKYSATTRLLNGKFSQLLDVVGGR